MSFSSILGLAIKKINNNLRLTLRFKPGTSQDGTQAPIHPPAPNPCSKSLLFPVHCVSCAAAQQTEPGPELEAAAAEGQPEQA